MPTSASSMQELTMHGLQQNLYKSCFRCGKSTCHVESSQILQPPKFLIIIVNRFKYINNRVIKDKGPIPVDFTFTLGPYTFSLLATVDHHGPTTDSGHYTTYINCCNKTFFCNDNKITEVELPDGRGSSTAYMLLYRCILE